MKKDAIKALSKKALSKNGLSDGERDAIKALSKEEYEIYRNILHKNSAKNALYFLKSGEALDMGFHGIMNIYYEYFGECYPREIEEGIDIREYYSTLCQCIIDDKPYHPVVQETIEAAIAADNKKRNY